MTVGFVGLGRMGRGMASRLAAGQEDLVVYDLAPDATAPLRERGARVAANVGELTRHSDVLFASLPGPPEVAACVFGEDGVLANLRPGQVLFDLSTSSIALTRRIDAAFAEHGAAVMDAPVSGGPTGAASGDLVTWVGGPREVFDAHRKTLELFSTPHYVGGLTTGTVTKLAHNMTGYLFLLSLAETFSLGVKAGADPLELWKALRLGVVGKQPATNMLVKQFLPGEYETPAFLMKLAHKDVSLATQLGRELGVPMRLSNLTLEEMTEALARGFGDQDSRSYLKLQLERAGVEIAVDPDELARAIKERP
ncbi:NAD(P)-dependent oxidoreductase [Amycolatopsis acidicola]|uniref:NAD(P)-dependent oxidoreductase n=1 Tax=Amycolatopsis acidicola TaxID=2596893 RepID=UPI00140956C0|nr:NAD(P)-dependent oxidoreductase [Amycolatopsis acidicola]